MKNIMGAFVVASTLALSCQASFARNPLKDHGGTSSTVGLGDYRTSCITDSSGVAQAGPRNIFFNGRNQQVVHLEAQGATTSQAFLTSLNESPIVINEPINFTVAKGDPDWLAIVLSYTPPGSTAPVSASFITATSKVYDPTGKLLIDNGRGKYTIPVGNNGGIPAGSTLVVFFFDEFGDGFNCTRNASDINEVQVNGKFVPIEQTAPAICGTSCSR